MSYLQMAKDWEAKRKAQKKEPTQVVNIREEARRRGRPFPYPLPETCGIGEVDPLDFRRLPDGSWINDPGWWKR